MPTRTSRTGCYQDRGLLGTALSGGGSARVHPIVPDQLPPPECQRQRIAPQRRVRTPRPLGVDVEVRLARVSTVAHNSERLSHADGITRHPANAATLHVREEDPDVPALEDDVVALERLGCLSGRPRVRLPVR